MALAPFLVFVFLDALATVDYDRCLYESDGSTLPAASLVESLQTLQLELLDSVVGYFHPLVFIFFAPFFWLAAMRHWRWANPRLVLMFWLGLLILLVAFMAPPSSTHDCDRKGTFTWVVPIIVALAGYVACVCLSLWSLIKKNAAK